MCGISRLVRSLILKGPKLGSSDRFFSSRLRAALVASAGGLKRKRPGVDLVPTVITIAMLNKRITDDVRLTVVQKIKIMMGLRAERNTQRAAHCRKTQFNVVIAEQK